MTPPQNAPLSHTWVWSVVLVTALHLLTTAGTWWVTDHGEILAVADRFLSTGHLDLKNLGPGWEDWTRIVTVRGSSESRFLPLSILSLVPFLLIDYLFGLRTPGEFRFVFLQGHAFVVLGLLIAGKAIQKLRGNPAMTTVAILVLGLNWPVWMIARRLGPEPVLFFLLAAFAACGSWTKLVVLFVLPWVHATGPLLACGALLSLFVEQPALSRRWLTAATAVSVVGVSSVALLWNLPVFGHAFLGGYGRFAVGQDFSVVSPASGLAALAPIVGWTLSIWWMIARAPGRDALRIASLWLPLVTFLGLMSHPDLLAHPEPERRLVPLLAATVIISMARAPALDRPGALGLILISLVSGVFGLSADFVDSVRTPFGAYNGPILAWLRMAFLNDHPIEAAFISVGLVSVAALAGRQLAIQLEDPAVRIPESQAGTTR